MRWRALLVVLASASAAAACSLLVDSGGLVDPVDPVPDGGASGVDGATGDSSVASDSSNPADDSAAPIDAGVEASAYAQAVAADQPVAWLRLGDSAGALFATDEADPLAALIQGSVTAGHPGAISGDTNGAFHFDGGKVRIQRKLAFPNFSPMTIELWIQPRLVDTNFRQLVNRVYGQPLNGYGVYVQSSVGVTCERHADGGNDNVYTGVIPSSSQFTHVVIVVDGTTMRGYVDSVEKDVDTSLTRPLADQPGDVVVGAASYDDDDTNFYGAIDEVALYDKALSAARIQEHYRKGRGL